MGSFAYYRLPYADSFTKVTTNQLPLVINHAEEIGEKVGFVIAPFLAGKETPAVLILPDEVETVQLNAYSEKYTQEPSLPTSASSCSRPLSETALSSFSSCSHPLSDTATSDQPADSYRNAFTSFHGAISDGRFKKLVLARTKRVDMSRSDESLFLDLCQRYPRLMVMLFSTPITGTWIIASPEILIEGSDNAYHTIALAGTMPYNDGYALWSDKNKREQHIVEQYIGDIITPFAQRVVKDGPYTTRAGDLQHLRTDFHFHLLQDKTIGNVISHLHPTPAVCGLPTNEARQFILTNEGIDRRYYSGFAGPVGINGETHLYVSLRCAELKGESATLYAGGGIMPDSDCLSEWQETEAKMQTINNVLQ